MAPSKGNGKAYAWLAAHVAYQGDDCLQWPFYALRGRGVLSHLGRQTYAARYMCELAHGPAPSPGHEAAHSCGNGHLRCTNPRHLSWKTKSENALDCRQHGTSARNRWGTAGKLTPDQVAEIRELKGNVTAYAVGETYGVSADAIYMIWQGKTFARPSKIKHWTPQERATVLRMLRTGKPHLEILTAVPGRTPGAVKGFIGRVVSHSAHRIRDRGVEP